MPSEIKEVIRGWGLCALIFVGTTLCLIVLSISLR